MRKLSVASVVAGVLLSSAPIAWSSNYHYAGGCGLQATEHPAGNPDTWAGLVFALTVVASDDPLRNPVSATVRCDVVVNGTTVDSGFFAGVGVVTGASATSFVWLPGDIVMLCESVATPDGWTESSCEDAALDPGDAAYEVAYEIAAPVVEALEPFVYDLVDPIACEVLRPLSGVFTDPDGPLYVDPYGDVFLLGDPAWDCPPYNEPSANRPRPPRYIPGGISINDDGRGVQWRPNGELANTRRWRCYHERIAVGFTVICDWLPATRPPSCLRASAVAVALPTFSSGGGLVWGRARTAAYCLGDLVSERVITPTAHGTPPNQFQTRSRTMTRQYVDRVECVVENGADAAPVPSYAADCDFLF